MVEINVVYHLILQFSLLEDPFGILYNLSHPY